MTETAAKIGWTNMTVGRFRASKEPSGAMAALYPA